MVLKLGLELGSGFRFDILLQCSGLGREMGSLLWHIMSL